MPKKRRLKRQSQRPLLEHSHLQRQIDIIRGARAARPTDSLRLLEENILGPRQTRPSLEMQRWQHPSLEGKALDYHATACLPSEDNARRNDMAVSSTLSNQSILNKQSLKRIISPFGQHDFGGTNQQHFTARNAQAVATGGAGLCSPFSRSYAAEHITPGVQQQVLSPELSAPGQERFEVEPFTPSRSLGSTGFSSISGAARPPASINTDVQTNPNSENTVGHNNESVMSPITSPITSPIRPPISPTTIPTTSPATSPTKGQKPLPIMDVCTSPLPTQETQHTATRPAELTPDQTPHPSGTQRETPAQYQQQNQHANQNQQHQYTNQNQTQRETLPQNQIEHQIKNQSQNAIWQDEAEDADWIAQAQAEQPKEITAASKKSLDSGLALAKDDFERELAGILGTAPPQAATEEDDFFNRATGQGQAAQGVGANPNQTHSNPTAPNQATSNQGTSGHAAPKGQNPNEPDSDVPPHPNHDVFDRMGLGLQYANSFDLGHININERLNDIEQALSVENTGGALGQSAARSTPLGGDINRTHTNRTHEVVEQNEDNVNVNFADPFVTVEDLDDFDLVAELAQIGAPIIENTGPVVENTATLIENTAALREKNASEDENSASGQNGVQTQISAADGAQNAVVKNAIVENAPAQVADIEGVVVEPA